MTYEELKTKSKDELLKTLLDLKKQQMEYRFEHSADPSKKINELRVVRRDVARVKTAMTATAKGVVASAKKETKKTTKSKKAA